MNQFSFSNIFYQGEVVLENDLVQHNHTAEMLLFYDGNFLQFKRMPTLDELIESITYLREYHLKNNQHHVKLLFPENQDLPEELAQYLKGEGFDIGFMEMYAIKPEQFPAIPVQENIVVEKVSAENKERFLDLKYEIDREFGSDFAEQKRRIHEKNFLDDSVMQLLAFYDGKAVGAVDVMISEQTAEIDGLVVLDDYQKKRIGSQLQKFVMDQCADKTVILIADGEDTPREMYKRQNYEYIGYQFEALKVYSKGYV